jgi:hypothetical protein
MGNNVQIYMITFKSLSRDQYELVSSSHIWSAFNDLNKEFLESSTTKPKHTPRWRGAGGCG